MVTMEWNDTSSMNWKSRHTYTLIFFDENSQSVSNIIWYVETFDDAWKVLIRKKVLFNAHRSTL